MKIRQLNIYLFTFVVILIYLAVIIRIYNGSIDDFAPKHIGVAYVISEGRPVTSVLGYLFYQISGYYAFIATIIHLTGADIHTLPVYPLIAVPYFVIFFTFAYSLSGRSGYSLMISALLTFFSFSIALTGTHKLGLWPHGVGEILLYTFILLIYKYFHTGNRSYTIPFLFIFFSLSFISYNVTYYTVLILACLISFSLLTDVQPMKDLMMRLTNSFAFLLVIFLNISNFLYKTFLPMVMESSDFFTNFQRSIYGFISQYFEHKQDDVLGQFIVSYPSSLTYTYIAKYAVYLIIIPIGLIFVCREIRSKGISSPVVLVYLSMVISILSFMAMRLLIGQFALPELFYIFVISTVFLALSHEPRVQKALIASLLILISVNFMGLYIASSSDITQSDNYDYITATSRWIFSNEDNYNNYISIPDQLTYAWCFITCCEYLPESGDINIKYLSTNDTLNLYLSKPLSAGETMVINYRSRYNAIGGWDHTESFKDYRRVIEANPSIKGKIFTHNDDISILFT